MSDSVRVTILCEDQQTECFIRYFLEKRGYGQHEFRSKFPKPGRSGSGEQWVREHFAEEMKAYHSRKNRAATCLIVAVDADPANTVSQRIQSLKDECDRQGVPFREPDDQVLIIVPKRNIETWLSYLRGEDVDEEREKPYPKYDLESACKGEVASLVEMCQRGKLRQPSPPSLEHTCLEARRLPK